ncbi:MAG: GIY-YIG nuclease family protein [Candidatus Roizmanbacteria bacterium]
MWYVYVLYSKKLSKRYVGLSSDLKRRYTEHNRGDSNFTNRGKPWRLVYYSAFCNKQDAEDEEEYLKSGQGRARLDRLLKNTLKENGSVA